MHNDVWDRSVLQLSGSDFLFPLSTRQRASIQSRSMYKNGIKENNLMGLHRALTLSTIQHLQVELDNVFESYRSTLTKVIVAEKMQKFPD